MEQKERQQAEQVPPGGDTGAARAQDAIDEARLNAALAALARFGGRDDGGVARETLTPIDLAARRYLIDHARSLGCDVSTDDCGNLFFRRAGREDLPPVLTGSHIDTQPVGGKLDGAYGVVAGLEVIHALNDAGLETRRPIEVVAWTNEEGSRFGPGAMGSSAFVDPARLADYRESRDADGTTFGSALDAALAATSDVRLRALRQSVEACVELHIEQGPVLEAAGVPLGVVTAIQSVRWFTVALTGTAAHAGTTPMEVRSDAMSAAVSLAHRLYALGAEAAPRGLRLTLGRWRVAPNSINTIPGKVEFTIDVRCVDEDVLVDFERGLRAAMAEVDHAWAGRIELDNILTRATTRFPTAMLDLLERGCARAATKAGAAAPLRLTSGAFHDAMYLADLCPTAMIFVPSRNGLSHNAAEYTDPYQLYLGAQALAYAVTELANR
jgi:N-carbamoyl-L-amino-acid hydrolase